MIASTWSNIVKDLSKICKKGKKLKSINQQSLTFFDETYSDLLGKYYQSCRVALITPPRKILVLNPLNSKNDSNILKMNLLDAASQDIYQLLANSKVQNLKHSSFKTQNDQVEVQKLKLFDSNADEDLNDMLDTSIYCQIDQYYGEVPKYLNNFSGHSFSTATDGSFKIQCEEQPLKNVDFKYMTKTFKKFDPLPQCFLLDSLLSIDENLDNIFPSNLTESQDAFLAVNASLSLINYMLDLQNHDKVLILNPDPIQNVILAAFQLRSVTMNISVTPDLTDMDLENFSTNNIIDHISQGDIFSVNLRKMCQTESNLHRYSRFIDPLSRVFEEMSIDLQWDLINNCHLQSFDKIILFNQFFNDRYLLYGSSKQITSEILQRSIDESIFQLRFAWNYLKIGGEIIYVTQTLNSSFNQNVVEQAFRFCDSIIEIKHPEFFGRLSNILHINLDCQLGTTIVPQMWSNIGPLYICKLKKKNILDIPIF